jgi:arabinogalactan oligomer/maltooligosaccharide transport system substrate-binding protein
MPFASSGQGSFAFENVISPMHPNEKYRGRKELKISNSRKAISTMMAAVIIIVIIVIAGVAIGIVYYYKPGPAAPIVGKITIWHGLFSTELSVWQERLNEFRAAYPNITVTFVFKADLESSLKTAIPAGQGPDLYTWGAQDWQGLFANSSLIVPIDDYVNDSVKALYYPSALATHSYKGHLYSLPLSAECITFFYNKKYITNPPQNTTALLSMLKNNQTGGAQYVLSLVAENDPYHMFPWVSAFGGYYYNDTTGLAGLNTTGTIEAATWWHQNIQPYLAPDLTGNAQRGLFLANKSAMFMTGPWDVAAIKSSNINFGMVVVPRVINSTYGVNALPEPFEGVKGIWMTKNCVQHNETAAAATFIKWFTSPTNQIALALDLGYIPVTYAAYNDATVASDPVIVGFGNQLKNTIGIPSAPQMGSVWTPTTDAWNAVFSGASTPQAAFQTGENAIITAIKTAYGHYP